MAMHDWNGDGKKDFSDDFMEYGIYKDVMGDDDDYKPTYHKPTYNKPSNDDLESKGCLILFLIVLGIMFVIALVSTLGIVEVIIYLCAFLCIITLAPTLIALYNIIINKLFDPDNEKLPVYYITLKLFLKPALICIGIFGLVILVIYFVYR